MPEPAEPVLRRIPQNGGRPVSLVAANVEMQLGFPEFRDADVAGFPRPPVDLLEVDAAALAHLGETPFQGRDGTGVGPQMERIASGRIPDPQAQNGEPHIRRAILDAHVEIVFVGQAAQVVANGVAGELLQRNVRRTPRRQEKPFEDVALEHFANAVDQRFGRGIAAAHSVAADHDLKSAEREKLPAFAQYVPERHAHRRLRQANASRTDAAAKQPAETAFPFFARQDFLVRKIAKRDARGEALRFRLRRIEEHHVESQILDPLDHFAIGAGLGVGIGPAFADGLENRRAVGVHQPEGARKPAGLPSDFLLDERQAPARQPRSNVADRVFGHSGFVWLEARQRAEDRRRRFRARIRIRRVGHHGPSFSACIISACRRSNSGSSIASHSGGQLWKKASKAMTTCRRQA